MGEVLTGVGPVGHMVVHEGVTLLWSPCSERVTVEWHVVSLPELEHGVEESPRCLHGVVACEKRGIALYAVVDEACIAVADAVATELTVAKVHGYALHLEASTGHLQPYLHAYSLVGRYAQREHVGLWSVAACHTLEHLVWRFLKVNYNLGHLGGHGFACTYIEWYAAPSPVVDVEAHGYECFCTRVCCHSFLFAVAHVMRSEE